MPGHTLHRLHVDRVQIRSFLAVHLDRDEVLVHVSGGLRVLERLALHHVAPVASRVANREQDRLVLSLCPLQRVRPPGVPVDRVVLVLEEVGTRLLGEAIGHRSQASETGAGAGVELLARDGGHHHLATAELRGAIERGARAVQNGLRLVGPHRRHPDA